MPPYPAKNQFNLGFFPQDPVYLGLYPPYMREVLGDRMPDFTQDEWSVVKGSSDFYGMNTYTTNLISMLALSILCVLHELIF